MSKKPVSKYEDLLKHVAELTDALQRERADAINVRRRSEEERAKMANFYKSLVVRDLLPTIDNFERALKHVPEQGKEQRAESKEEQKLREWVEGAKKILTGFEDALTKIGVKRIKTVGEPFDPNYHEAVSMEDGDGTHEVVSEELQAGYIIGDEVLRHAMVKVRMEK